MASATDIPQPLSHLTSQVVKNLVLTKDITGSLNQLQVWVEFAIVAREFPTDGVHRDHVEKLEKFLIYVYKGTPSRGGESLKLDELRKFGIGLVPLGCLVTPAQVARWNHQQFKAVLDFVSAESDHLLKTFLHSKAIRSTFRSAEIYSNEWRSLHDGTSLFSSNHCQANYGSTEINRLCQEYGESDGVGDPPRLKRKRKRGDESTPTPDAHDRPLHDSSQTGGDALASEPFAPSHLRRPPSHLQPPPPPPPPPAERYGDVYRLVFADLTFALASGEEFVDIFITNPETKNKLGQRPGFLTVWISEHLGQSLSKRGRLVDDGREGGELGRDDREKASER